MIKSRIKMLLKQKILWIAATMICIFGYITFQWNYDVLELQMFTPISAADKFLISFTIGNNASLFLYPVFASIPCSIIYTQSTKTWITKAIPKKLFCRNILVDLTTSFMSSAALFIISFLFYYIIMVLFSKDFSYQSKLLPFYDFAPLFPSALSQNPYIISVIYLIHTIIVAGAFSCMCFSLVIVTDNCPVAVICLAALNYFSYCILSLPVLGKIVSYFIPFFLFEVASFTIDPVAHYCQIVSMYLFSCFLLHFRIRKQRSLINKI